MPSTYVFPVQECTPRAVKEFKSPMSSGKDPQRPAFTPYTPVKRRQTEFTDVVSKENYKFFNNNLGSNQILVIREETDPKLCRDYETRTLTYYFCMQCCELDHEQKPTVAKVEIKSKDERDVYGPKSTEHLPGCCPKDYEETIEKYAKIEAESIGKQTRSKSNPPDAKKRRLEEKKKDPTPPPSEFQHLLNFDPIPRNAFFLSAKSDSESDPRPFYFDKLWIISHPGKSKNGQLFKLEEELSNGRSTFACSECRKHNIDTLAFLSINGAEFEIRVDKNHGKICKPKEFDLEKF